MILQLKYQGNSGLATEVFNDFNGLYFWLEAKKEQFEHSDFLKLFEASQKKLDYYLFKNGMPSMGLFRSCRFLDPRQISYFEKDPKELMIDIPELKVALDEWPLYLDIIKQTKFEVTFDIYGFWLMNKKKLKQLYEIAEWLLVFPNNSADCERSISMYNKILTDDRNRLSEESLVKLNFVYFNRNFSNMFSSKIFEINDKNDDEDCILVEELNQ